jgi:hypothetical protein
MKNSRIMTPVNPQLDAAAILTRLKYSFVVPEITWWRSSAATSESFFGLWYADMHA